MAICAIIPYSYRTRGPVMLIATSSNKSMRMIITMMVMMIMMMVMMTMKMVMMMVTMRKGE